MSETLEAARDAEVKLNTLFNIMALAPREGEDTADYCKRIWTVGYNAGAAHSAHRISELEKALRCYENVCSNCLSLRDDHDDDGYVDLMDEIGTRICGEPEFSADAALATD